MPGRAAQTRADAGRSNGAATLHVRVPLRYWLVGGSAAAVSVWVSGFGPGLPSPLSSWGRLVTSASPGPGGAPAGRATLVVRAGPRRASGAPSPSAPSPPSRLGGRGWRRPASPRAGHKTDQRSPPRPARCVAALLASLPGHHVHLPPAPADWVALLFPCSQGMKRTAARWRGASQASCDRLPPADPHRRRPRPLGIGQSSPVTEGEPMTTPTYCPTCHRAASGRPRGQARSRAPT
jgi:hypothetical protein